MNRFISIEGIEGVGKSTALKFIENYFNELKLNYVTTREPGGTKIAEKIREVLLAPDPNEAISPETELLLMFACRAQHIARFILPALHSGKWVVSDRYVDASYAYQSGGRGIDIDRIAMLEEWIVNNTRPALTILLDAPPTIGLARAKHRGPQDRIEMEKIDFFARVRDIYLIRAKQDPMRFRVIDATRPLNEVQAEIKQYLDELIASTPRDK